MLGVSLLYYFYNIMIKEWQISNNIKEIESTIIEYSPEDSIEYNHKLTNNLPPNSTLKNIIIACVFSLLIGIIIGLSIKSGSTKSAESIIRCESWAITLGSLNERQELLIKFAHAQSENANIDNID
uniref:Uncharacterized protein n=1 Tax=Orbilia brochopaga TaxID=3140254 RepID=A0A4Y5MV67_9PEZI|nr:hypothetical protein [Drechslerella brochopaga]